MKIPHCSINCFVCTLFTLCSPKIKHSYRQLTFHFTIFFAFSFSYPFERTKKYDGKIMKNLLHFFHCYVLNKSSELLIPQCIRHNPHFILDYTFYYFYYIVIGRSVCKHEMGGESGGEEES